MLTTIDATKRWLYDLPQQFLDKRNIEIFIRAFGRQLQELWELFDGLNNDLELDTAGGKNLDYVGTIIPLTRMQAGILAGLNNAEPVMGDEQYRQYLRYMALRNTSECTYADIMWSIELLWGNKNIKYVEDPERPATILIELSEWELDDEIDHAEGRTDPIRPAGVQLFYTIIYSAIIDESDLEHVIAPNIDIHAELPYFRAVFLDGSVYLDGSEKLNAETNYDLIPHFAFAIKLPWDNTAAAGISLHTEAVHSEKFEAPVAEMNVPLDYWDRKGKELDAVEADSKASVDVEAELEHDEGMELNILSEHNPAFFNGDYLLDGCIKFDSIYHKEEVS